MSDKQQPLFDKHEQAEKQDHGKCPECQSELTIKHSKKGSFIGCVNYPSCEYTRSLIEQERVEDKLLPNTECPKCQSILAVKQGRYGMFIGCSNFPDCDHIENSDRSEPIAEADIHCPSCNQGLLFKKTNRFGKNFYACDQYPSCKYVLNHAPIPKACPECGWPVMIKRQMSSGEVHICPQKKCGFKIKL